MPVLLEAPPIRAEQRFMLSGVDREQYEKLLDALGERRNLRVTWDGCRLELMTKSRPHEWYKKLFGLLIEMLCIELQIAMEFGGEMTLRSIHVDRGIEGDQLYWIQNAAAVCGRSELDFNVDPPPDLSLEIDVSQTVIPRLPIYAAIRVPEVWRFDGRSLEVLLLNRAGEYDPSDASAAFPFLPVQELLQFVQIDEEVDVTTRVNNFVEWIREQEFEVEYGCPGRQFGEDVAKILPDSSAVH